MSDKNAQSVNPTSSFPPPAPKSPRRRVRGSLVILGGIVFAILPILITLVASVFIDDAFNEGSSAFGVLPWYTFFTAPVGAVVVLIGLIIGVVNVTRRNN